MTPIDWIGGTLVFIGALFGIIGAIGVLRFPELFSRMHAAGVTDTLCAFLVLGGLGLIAGFTLPLAKLFLILMFLWFTTPTATHALAKAARHGGVEPRVDGDEEGSSSNS